MHSGELIVVGRDQVDIPLHRLPSEVHVRFKEEHELHHRHRHHHVPCDPGSVDSFECDVHYSNLVFGGFVLRINWSVSSVREIVWHVSY